MHLLKSSAVRLAARHGLAQRWSYTIQRRLTTKPPPFPTVPTCPSPSCSCAPTPQGLDIDHKSTLNGVITGYSEQVLICTGRDDWASRIEDELDGDNLAANLKQLLGRGGTYSDPFNNISVLNSSFPSSTSPEPDVPNSSVYLLPSFKYVPYLARHDFSAIQALAKGYLLAEKLHSMHDGLSPESRDLLTRNEDAQSLLSGVEDVKDVLVLICGHGGRDERCGIMGTLLREEFEKRLSADGFTISRDAVPVTATDAQEAIGMNADPDRTGARVGLISHIGGHKFAGNVIIYIPPGSKVGSKAHPLAGCGIWYGRVEPRHVEGLVAETILRGTVVEELYRGGIDADRQMLRL